LSRWRRVSLAFNFGRLGALSSTVRGSPVPADNSALKLCPVASMTTTPIPVRDKRIQNIRFLDATVRRTRAGLVASAAIHMDVRGLFRYTHVSSTMYPFDRLRSVRLSRKLSRSREMWRRTAFWELSSACGTHLKFTLRMLRA
jgi:hypothetical protein